MSLSQGVDELNAVIRDIERIKDKLEPWINDLPPQCDLTEAMNSIDNAVDGINEIRKMVKEQKQDD